MKPISNKEDIFELFYVLSNGHVSYRSRAINKQSKNGIFEIPFEVKVRSMYYAKNKCS